jgi:carboxyl-terminal processing protease
MLPASNRGTGMNLGFPDVCNTPTPAGPVPIPYPNIAMASSASTFATVVYVGMVNALNMNSSIPNTNGDEAGSAQPNMGKAGYTMGNPIVNIEKVPAISLACPTNGNNYNCSLAAVIVPAVSVVSYTQRGLDSTVDRVALEAATSERAEGADPGRADRSVSVRRSSDGWLEATLAIVSTDVARELRVAFDRLGVSVPSRLRVDLRGCPGGDLEGALDLASRFTSPGALLAVVEDSDGDREERRSTGGPWLGCELELLIDQQTASAAEVLAGSLRSAAGARLVGERSYGKGRIQAVRAGQLRDVGEALLPSGEHIEGVGLEPG